MAEPVAPVVVVDGSAIQTMTHAELRALATHIVAKLREHPPAQRVTPPNHGSCA
ncbi:MAG: hypothetical protein ACXV3F_14080 [Frankiaceae bacterium]